MKKYTIQKTNRETDFSAISQVYYQTWQDAYRNLIPKSFLEKLDPQKTWHPETRADHTFIAVSDDQKIVGVISYGPSRKSTYKNFGEIYSLYVLPDWQGLGIGQQLFEKALAQLKMDFENIYLLVLKNNIPAQKFYQHHDFVKTDNIFEDKSKLGNIEEVMYIYQKGDH